MTARIQSPLQCVHCHTTETPLWRAGPTGPKTLCNACGVRWKKTGSVIPRTKRSAPSSSGHPSKPSSSIRKRVRTTGTNNNNNNSDANGVNSAGGVATTNSSAQPSAKDPYPSFANNNNINNNSNNKNKPSNLNSFSSSHRDNQSSDLNGNQHHQSNTNNKSSGGNNRQPSSGANPITTPLVDPAARVAAAAMPAPRPISVFRVSDVQRSKYESVFSGLMVVQRARDGHLSHHYSNNKPHGNGGSSSTSNVAHFNPTTTPGSAVDKGQSATGNNSNGNMRTRTQTPKASAFFSDLSQQQQQQQKENVDNKLAASTHNAGFATIVKDADRSGRGLHGHIAGGPPASPSPGPSPTASPTPIDVGLAQRMFAAETLAPSPSPSPPPMPRKRMAEGGGFRLVLSTIADKKVRD